MSSEYLFSIILTATLHSVLRGHIGKNLTWLRGLSPESLVLSSVTEDADEVVEPAAHLETKCVTVALDSYRDNLVTGVFLLLLSSVLTVSVTGPCCKI